MNTGESGSESNPRRTEILRALGALYGGTALLGLVALGLPALEGLLQGLLAVLLFLIPSWVLKHTDKTIDHMGVDLSPWWPTLRASLLCGLLIYPVFTLGFHLFHTEVTGAQAAWSWARLERFDEALLDAPKEPCDAGREATRAWIAGDGIWIVAPAAQGLVVELGGDQATTRIVSCTRGTPHAGPARTAQTGATQVRPGAGLWMSLRDRDAFSLQLTYPDAASPAPPILTGARDIEVAAPGILDGERSWLWLIPYLIVHLGIVALPEEWFFRGYLQTRLDERWGTPWRFLGADLGWGFVASALAFALLHPILLPGLHRLLVFFPALLFGYLRARTGNIGAAVVIHATSNLLLAILVGMYRWP